VRIPLGLVARRHDLVAIPITDRAELELPRVGLVDLEDMEWASGSTVDTSNGHSGGATRSTMAAAVAGATGSSRSSESNSIPLRTDEDFTPRLHKFFQRRARVPLMLLAAALLAAIVTGARAPTVVTHFTPPPGSPWRSLRATFVVQSQHPSLVTGPLPPDTLGPSSSSRIGDRRASAATSTGRRAMCRSPCFQPGITGSRHSYSSCPRASRWTRCTPTRLHHRRERACPPP